MSLQSGKRHYNSKTKERPPRIWKPSSHFTPYNNVQNIRENHPKKNKLYSKPCQEQHAFKESHSRTTQLTNLVNHRLNPSKTQEKPVTIYLDMKKIFERVWNKRLLYKLKFAGTVTFFIWLVTFFLSNKTFNVKDSAHFSSTKYVQVGVP